MSASALFAGPPQKIVVDTDSGFFNDDGAALVMLVRSPAAVSVAGVTLVSGNVWTSQGLGYTGRILKLLNRADIPLLPGAEAPLLHTAAMAEVEASKWGPVGYRGAFGLPFTDSSSRSPNAVDFLIQTVEQSPGDVTVLALGPMTNLAMALRLRPDLETRIKRLVFMGGNVRTPGNSTPKAEFNFWFDPEAAQAVLRSRIPQKVMFGLDVCNRAKLTKAHFDQLAAARTPITELYKEDFGNRYPGFLKHPDATVSLWDELTAAWLIDPGLVTASESSYLDVDTRFGPSYGAVVPLQRELAPGATPVQVMLDLNFPRVFALYKNLLTR